MQRLRKKNSKSAKAKTIIQFFPQLIPLLSGCFCNHIKCAHQTLSYYLKYSLGKGRVTIE